MEEILRDKIDEPVSFNVSPVASLLAGYELPKKTRYSQRTHIINLFLERLNAHRNGYKPLSFGFVKMKLKHLNIGDLYYLYSVCNQSKNFGATWWYELDPSKH